MDAYGNTKRRYENATPVTDEGWWESVLGEERRHSAHVPRRPHAPQKMCLAATKQQESTQLVVVNADREQVAEGHILPAEIKSALSYSAIARLQAGIEGLIHATEMPLKAWQTPCDILMEGQQVQVRVLHADPAYRRMG